MDGACIGISGYCHHPEPQPINLESNSHFYGLVVASLAFSWGKDSETGLS
jgi:hypothetical protein